MITLVNLTSVGLDIVDESGLELLYLPPPPKERAVQLAATTSARGTVIASNRVRTNEIPVRVDDAHMVFNLPDPATGIVYVVPSVVFESAQLAHRFDLAAPGPTLKDAEGKPRGCQGLRLRALPDPPSARSETDDEPHLPEVDYELVDRCKRHIHRLPEAYLEDFEKLLGYVEELEAENARLFDELERLSPPPADGATHPMVERATARFRQRVAELQAQRAQETQP